MPAVVVVGVVIVGSGTVVVVSGLIVAAVRDDGLAGRARAVGEPEGGDDACRDRDDQRQQRGPDPVAGVPAEPAAPGRAQGGDDAGRSRQPLAAFEAVLLALAVRGAAARTAPFFLLSAQAYRSQGSELRSIEACRIVLARRRTGAASPSSSTARPQLAQKLASAGSG